MDDKNLTWMTRILTWMTRIPTFARRVAEGDTEEIHPSDGDAVEYFFASDASAIIEHTNRVLFLEDDDVAAVKDGVLSIHRINRYFHWRSKSISSANLGK
jgi:hypothetical protein